MNSLIRPPRPDAREIRRCAELLKNYAATPLSVDALEFNCPLCGKRSGRLVLLAHGVTAPL
jgi:hypothetical protein